MSTADEAIPAVLGGERAGLAAAPLPRGTLQGMFLLSASILVLQVALTRLLSVVLWYHFAFVAISLAMLGLALGGIALYLSPALLRATPRLVPWLCRLSTLGTIAALAYAIRHPIDTVTSASVFGGQVAAFYLVLLVPFLTSGLAVSAQLSFHSRRISTLYLADLCGAALGCVAVVALLELAGAPAAILAAALGFALAGWVCRRSSLLDPALVLACAAVLGWQVVAQVFEPDHMHGQPDENAELGHEKVLARWNSHSRILVTQTGPAFRLINIDGGATTGINRLDELATPDSVRRAFPWLVLYGGATPYAILPESPETLVIGPGGGLDILTGLFHGAHVTAIELNGVIHDVMTEPPLADWSGNVYRAPGVEAIHDEARSWIRRSERRFDLIQAMMIDTWAATTAGAFALAENAVYTVEAFEDFYAHLTDDGVVHYTRWSEEEPRQSLRVLTLIVEVLRRRGIEDPRPYVVVFHEESHDLGQASILWARQPFSAEDLTRLEAHGERRAALPLTKMVWPGEAHDNALSAYLSAPDKDEFLARYEWDVTPTTDDRPFFFNTMRLRDVSKIDERFVNEQAVGVLVTILVTVSVLVGLAFLVPLALAWRRIRAQSGAGTVLRLAYFCALGFGFMLLEIPLLQRFGLYLGHPTYTLSTVLTVLLAGAGLGSFLAGALFGARPLVGARVALGAIVLAVALLGTLVPAVLEHTLTEPLGVRILLTVALLLPLGILLGCPLPLGVRALGEKGQGLVPWAWGMNGATSVFASVLAVAIGLYAGFQAAAVTGGLCYLLALVTAGWLAPRGGPPAASAERVPAARS